MKQVSSKIYDKDFFHRVYGNDNLNTDFHRGLSKSYYHEMAILLKLDPNDTVVDYGCGNGSLSFLLWKKYQCNIISFDYSKEAISICKDRLDKYKRTFPDMKINFQVANNDSLPKLKNIKAVYFCDVIEHMYDTEIKVAINEIKKWSMDGTYLVFHTDNNLYLYYIRPLINLMMIIFQKKKIRDIINESEEEKKVHINLTNFIKLKKSMKKLGLVHISTTFPKITKDKIKKQLSILGAYKPIVSACYYFLNIIPHISPSFYSIYSTKPR